LKGWIQEGDKLLSNFLIASYKEQNSNNRLVLEQNKSVGFHGDRKQTSLVSLQQEIGKSWNYMAIA
jgi:hypothetical protein